MVTHKIVRTACAIGLAAVVTAGPTAVTPAAAAGGGCRYGSYPDGFRVDVCVSIEATSARGDAYVDRVPGSCAAIRLEVRERDGNWDRLRAATQYGCSTGYFGPLWASTTAGPRYYTRVCVVDYNGFRRDCSSSPEAWR